MKNGEYAIRRQGLTVGVSGDEATHIRHLIPRFVRSVSPQPRDIPYAVSFTGHL